MPPIITLAGYSGSGKTTFIEKLIPALTCRGLKVATIKHDVHGFEMDKPGKDSWRHKHAGATASIISCASKVGLVMDTDHDYDPKELARLFPKVDLILTEGFKNAPYPKLEIFRPEATKNKDPLCQNDSNFLALISDHAFSVPVPRFSLSDATGVADFLIRIFGLYGSVSKADNLIDKDLPCDQNYNCNK
jgi:molybdopterin-guanine dinucleotide biosynthesis protein B